MAAQAMKIKCVGSSPGAGAGGSTRVTFQSINGMVMSTQAGGIVIDMPPAIAANYSVGTTYNMLIMADADRTTTAANITVNKHTQAD